MAFTLGIISDIHGDLDSLKLALNLLQRERVDTILCAGDLVEKGEHGSAVTRLIRDREIPCVMGNHDEAAIGNQQWLKENADLTHPNMRGRLLAPDVLDYLRDLSRTLRFVWEGKRVLLAHGTPTSNVMYLFPYTAPATYRNIARTADADVILFGHTHTPTSAFFEDVWFFNPGSVCIGGRYENRTCATVHLPDCAFRVFDINSGACINVTHTSSERRGG